MKKTHLYGEEKTIPKEKTRKVTKSRKNVVEYFILS